MKDAHRLYVGIDWATETHQVCVLAADGEFLAERVVPHSGVGLSDLCGWLSELGGGEPAQVGVSIELPHGPVVEALLEQGFAVYTINPKQVDRFRDRFTLAGAKDDRRDALVLASALRTDLPCFRRLQVDAPVVIELREWSRMVEELQQERTRLTNRMREQLRRCFPQMLAVSSDPGTPWMLALWKLIPTPEAAQRARPSRVARLLQRHRIRKLDATMVLAQLREPPLTVAPGTVAAATAHLAALGPRVQLVNEQLTVGRARLDKLCVALAAEVTPGQAVEQRDVTILRSLPGVGRIVLATLLAEAAQPLRERDYHALRALGGVAPVTRRSGKRCTVVMRQACHVRIRNALYHWSRTAVQHDPASRAGYAALRQRGHSHGRALRTISCTRRPVPTGTVDFVTSTAGAVTALATSSAAANT